MNNEEQDFKKAKGTESMPIDILKQIWPEWSIGKRIGGGSYGTVYEASRNEYGVENHAAIKIISIPASEAEIDALRSEGLDMQATKTHFQTIVNDFVNEIRLMVSLDGRPNIVNVKDYKVVEKKGEFGWHIFILMELLTPFAVHTCDHQMTEAEVIKLGCDICTALETCAEEKIIHRDIKPGNILVHKSGDFKLGDFGIARKLENMTGGLSQRCTPKYMAPEVATSMYYDERVDIYSLGIVLYELLNGRHIPFQPNKQINSLADIENAVRRRNSGEAFDGPSNASPAMADVILRACAYDPNRRFASATEMKQALMSVANGTYLMAASSLDRTTSVRRAPANYDTPKKMPDHLDRDLDMAKGCKSKPTCAHIIAISAGTNHAVGLKSDGTVITTEKDSDMANWTDIVAISAGWGYTIGLKSDGSVISSICGPDVTGWRNIVAISAGYYHAVGLKSDGTVVAAGGNENGECNVVNWTNIVAISAGLGHTVGLKSDGTVVATGRKRYGQCKVRKWRNIIAISAGAGYTIGLKSDGTVVAVGDNEEGQCDVTGWWNIAAICAGSYHAVGLHPDGTVVAEGTKLYDYGHCDVYRWTDIVAISAGNDYTIGLKSDGTVVCSDCVDFDMRRSIANWSDAT